LSNILLLHKKKYLIELTGIVMENERSRILVKFTRFLISFRLIEDLDSGYFQQNSGRLIITTRFLIDLIRNLVNLIKFLDFSFIFHHNFS